MDESRRFNFIKKSIEALEPPSGKPDASGRVMGTWVDYQDTQNRFLKLRIQTSGKKTFYYVRRKDGGLKWIKLDTFPEMSVFQARERCNELSGEYAKGNDPEEEKRIRKRSLTFGELFERFLELHARPHKRSVRDDLSIFKNHLESIKHRLLSEVTPDMVAKIHNHLGESRKTQANRTIALIKAVFNFGEKQGHFTGKNPAARVKMFPEKSRDRFLDAAELKRFFEALGSEPNQDMKDFFTLALFTGARRGNLQSMKWANLDLEAGVWSIPGDESKNHDEMKIILSREAIDILKRRKLHIVSLYVFPSESKTGHITEPKRTWKSILKRAKIVDLRIHDLRRTLGSWQAAGGSSLPVIGKSLGHKNQSTTAIYARLNLDPVRESVNRAIDAMREAGK